MVASVDAKPVLQPLDIQERQQLKIHEDQLIDILVVLDSNLDTIVSLKEKYREYCQEVVLFPAGHFTIDAINNALEEKQQEVLLNRKKIGALQTKIRGTMSLVKF